MFPSGGLVGSKEKRRRRLEASTLRTKTIVNPTSTTTATTMEIMGKAMVAIADDGDDSDDAADGYNGDDGDGSPMPSFQKETI